jgi:hypothetical protein
MPEQNPKCPKCNTRMEPGYLPDATYGGIVLPKWAAGEPTKNWLGAFTTKGKATYPVVTYRCQKCGYLESYAAI